MLKRVHRLRSRGDFKRTLAGQRLCANDCFVVYGILNTSNNKSRGSIIENEPRLGFIVSKKIHKKSVYRNRIKRRLRELIRTSLLDERRQILCQFRTLVFIARNGSLHASFSDLQYRMDRCFQLLKKAEERC